MILLWLSLSTAVGGAIGAWLGAWTWRAYNYERTKAVVAAILLESEMRAHKHLHQKGYGEPE